MGSKMVVTDYFDSPGGKVEDSVFIVRREAFSDSRGTFFESFREGDLEKPFDTLSWCRQTNVSTSHPWVFRGLHAQTGASCQAKMVSCVIGSVFDVIVDFRPDSRTFGRFMVVNLTASSHESLYVPRGFLHGFLSDETPLFSIGMTPLGDHALESGENVFTYMCDNVYDRESEITVDPMSFFSTIGPDVKDEGLAKIAMAIRSKKIVFSDKDRRGLDYRRCFEVVRDEYKKEGKPWYRG